MAPYAGLWLNLDADGYVTQITAVIYDEDGTSKRTVKSKLPALSTLADAVAAAGVWIDGNNGRFILNDG